MGRIVIPKESETSSSLLLSALGTLANAGLDWDHDDERQVWCVDWLRCVYKCIFEYLPELMVI